MSDQSRALRRFQKNPGALFGAAIVLAAVLVAALAQVLAPHDPDDFGRCHRLLQAFPEWRSRLDEMRAHPGWGPLVDAWSELEALYAEEIQSGKAPKLYARMCALRGEK